MHHLLPHCAHIHSWISINIQWELMNGSGCHFCSKACLCFRCTSVSVPFCQSAALLSSVPQQQHVMGYCWEGSVSTAIPPPSTSDVMSQNNKIEGTTFGVVLIYMCVCVCMHVLHSFSWIHPNPIRMVIGTLTDFSYSSFHIPRLQFSVLSNVRLLNASFCFENIWYGAF